MFGNFIKIKIIAFLSIISLIFTFSTTLASSLDIFKKQCEEIGFINNTENFGQCVLKLRKSAKKLKGTSHNLEDLIREAKQKLNSQDEVLAEKRRQEKAYTQRIEEENDRRASQRFWQTFGGVMMNYGLGMAQGNTGNNTYYSPNSLNTKSGIAVKTNEYTKGLTKICVYNRMGNIESLTISATSICPLTP